MYKIFDNNLCAPPGYINKTLLVMRLTVILLIATFMQVSATGFAQRITLNKKNVSLHQVFAEVRKQTGFDVLWESNQLKGSATIDAAFNNTPLEDVIKKCLDGKPLVFTIEDKTVVIKEKGPSFLDRAKSVILNLFQDLRGRVLDENGKPLPNASIQIKGKPTVYKSNENGEFVIDNVADDGVLIIRYVGYKQLEINLKDAIMPLEIKLSTTTGDLAEVRITYSTGYQNVPKERATGSFVQLSNEDINRTVSTNILDRIKNISNGLVSLPVGQIYIPDGGGSGNEQNSSDISIRGLSTINANQKPLIVIDNFPYEETGVPPYANTLNNLNPNDVESITILRDAAAASIWGARSANGVIVIKTKAGKFNQRSNVQFTSNVNLTERPDLFKVSLISSADAIAYEKELFNTGIYNDHDDQYPSFNYYPVLSPVMEILLAKRKGAISEGNANAQLEQLANHDVRNDVSKYLMRTSVNQQYNLNLSGGGDKMNYFASVGYDKNLATSIGNQDDRLTLNVKNTYRPIKNLELNTFIAYTQSRVQNNGLDYIQYLGDGRRNYTAPYAMLADMNGNPLHISIASDLRSAYIDTLKIKGILDWHYRPLDEINNNDNNTRVFNARFGGGLKYTVLNGLSLNINGQYEKSLTNLESYYSTKTYFTRNLINQYMFLNAQGQPQYPVPLAGILDYKNSTYTAYNLRGMLNFDKSWGRHTISAIAGADVRETEFDSNESRKYGYDPLTLAYAVNMDFKNQYAMRPAGGGLINNVGSLMGRLNRFLSYYSNVGYTLLDKYTFTASARIDGSNYFGIKANLRYVPLWSVGTSWDIKKESFFKSQMVNSLKLRATYGFNGNLDNRATALPTIRYSNGSNIYNNSQQYASRFTPPNPGLTWEKIRMINLGIDFGLLNNRISGSIEYYTKNTNNLISTAPLDETSGISDFRGNVGGLKSKGLDIQLIGQILNKAMKLYTTLSFNYNANKVTSYYTHPGLLDASTYVTGGLFLEGMPTGSLYSYKWAGLDHLTGNPIGIINGEKVSFDKMLNNSIVKPKDLIYHGSIVAPVFGYMMNTLSYKSFSASFNITYRFGYYFKRPSVNFSTLPDKWGAHGDYGLRWQKPGDELTTDVPSMPLADDNRYQFYSNSEILVEKGDHVRFNDFRLSYNLSGIKMKKLPFNANIFIYANNLNVIVWRANKKGIDPDFNNSIPTPRSIAFGLTLNY